MDTELQVPTLDDNMAQVMNVSFLNDDGSLLELSMMMIDEETPIFQVFEPALNSSFVEGQEPECQGFSSSSMTFESESTTFPHDSATIPSETTTHQSESTTFPRDSATIPSETPGVMPTPRSSGVFSIAVQDDDSDPDNQFNFSKELEDRAKQREVDHELQFKYKVLNKLKMDIKSRISKRSAAKFLFESFGDALNDYSFVCWLAKKLELKPCRLKDIMKNFHEEFAPRNSLSSSSHQSIYSFWLKEWRNGRDVVKILKATYLAQYGSFVDPNIEEEDVILKKTNKVKRYIKARNV